jgi:hypothetical protein
MSRIQLKPRSRRKAASESVAGRASAGVAGTASGRRLLQGNQNARLLRSNRNAASGNSRYAASGACGVGGKRHPRQPTSNPVISFITLGQPKRGA